MELLFAPTGFVTRMAKCICLKIAKSISKKKKENSKSVEIMDMGDITVVK